MKKLLFSVLFLATTCSALMLTPMQTSVSIGTPVLINASVENATAASQCILWFEDMFNNPVVSKVIYPDDFGYIAERFVLTDSFVVGQNYSVNMSCHGDSASYYFTADVGGNSALSIWWYNNAGYYRSHPTEGVGVLILGVLSLLGIGVLISKVMH